MTVEQVAYQMGYKAPQLAGSPEADALRQRIAVAAAAACDAIDNDCGQVTPFAPVPPPVAIVALSAAVDLLKHPDATFDVAGNDTSGVLTMSRDLIGRYSTVLHPYRSIDSWGVA